MWTKRLLLPLVVFLLCVRVAIASSGVVVQDNDMFVAMSTTSTVDTDKETITYESRKGSKAHHCSFHFFRRGYDETGKYQIVRNDILKRHNSLVYSSGTFVVAHFRDKSYYVGYVDDIENVD